MNTLTRFKEGDPLNIPVGAYNAFCDVAEFHMRQGRRIGTPATTAIPNGPALFVRFKNETGAAIQPFRALSADYDLDEVLTIEGDEHTVSGAPILKVSTQDLDDDDSTPQILITQEQVADDEFGMACIRGVCVAKVNVDSLEHRYAYLPDGETILRSAFEGPVRILQRPTTDLELQSCLVDVVQHYTATTAYSITTTGASPYQNGNGKVYSITLAASATDESIALTIPGGNYYDVDFRINGYASAYTTSGSVTVDLYLYDEASSFVGTLLSFGGSNPNKYAARTISIPTSPATLLNLTEQFSFRRTILLPSGLAGSATGDATIKVRFLSQYGASVTVDGHCSLTATATDEVRTYTP